MTRDELEKRNVGENLDAIMCLDPRGYGVCRILYAGSRAYTGEPTAMHAAEALCKAIHPGDPVYILVGFVLLPHKVPEMDGSVSAILLARSWYWPLGQSRSSSARRTAWKPLRNAAMWWVCMCMRTWIPPWSCR